MCCGQSRGDWSDPVEGHNCLAELGRPPRAGDQYVRRIEELIRCPVALVSTSPDRKDTIWYAIRSRADSCNGE